MRLVFKALVVVVLALGIGNYLIYLKTGQMPIAGLRERLGSDWLVDIKETYSPGQLTARAKKTVDELMEDETTPPVSTTVYKWTDANGQVHYGDKPQATNAEQVEINMRNAISPPDQTGNTIADEPGVTPQQAPLEKARAAAEAMKARIRDQESLSQ